MKKAIITGVNGQDGSYLAELLIKKNYSVLGVVRRKASQNFERLKNCLGDSRFNIAYGDVTDPYFIYGLVKDFNPDEFYNLAAMSFVAQSWKSPYETFNTNAGGVLNCLEAILKNNKRIRFYQASTSEMFGNSKEIPQSEKTPFNPASPYAASKLFGHTITKTYRESYGLHASNGILFNHESPRRGLEFVTRKITDGVARIVLGLQDHISLGNLDAKRDLGHSRDYVMAMWLMLQQDVPDDYVIATGKTVSIKEMLGVVFKEAGLNWKDHIWQSEEFFRPNEVNVLCGDSSKAKEKLGWKSEINYESLLKEMYYSDLERLKKEIA